MTCLGALGSWWVTTWTAFTHTQAWPLLFKCPKTSLEKFTPHILLGSPASPDRAGIFSQSPFRDTGFSYSLRQAISEASFPVSQLSLALPCISLTKKNQTTSQMGEVHHGSDVLGVWLYLQSQELGILNLRLGSRPICRNRHPSSLEGHVEPWQPLASLVLFCVINSRSFLSVKLTCPLLKPKQ